MRQAQFFYRSVLVGVAVVGMNVSANPVITIDPGPARSAGFYRFNFSDLIGAPLDGRTIDLFVRFRPGSFIAWEPGDFQSNRSVHIDYFATPIGDGRIGMSASGGVTDIGGQLIGQQPPTRSVTSFGGAPLGFGGASLFFEPGTEPITFYGANVTMTLPNVPGATINWSAVTFSQYGEGLYTVSIVPEPTTLTLLFLALGAMALVVSHRNASTDADAKLRSREALQV